MCTYTTNEYVNGTCSIYLIDLMVRPGHTDIAKH